jgi:hypothetical protein
MPELCSHYRLEGHALVRESDGPAGLPARLERVEVLLTADVAPHDIACRGTDRPVSSARIGMEEPSGPLPAESGPAGNE